MFNQHRERPPGQDLARRGFGSGQPIARQATLITLIICGGVAAGASKKKPAIRRPTFDPLTISFWRSVYAPPTVAIIETGLPPSVSSRTHKCVSQRTAACHQRSRCSPSARDSNRLGFVLTITLSKNDREDKKQNGKSGFTGGPPPSGPMMFKPQGSLETLAGVISGQDQRHVCECRRAL